MNESTPKKRFRMTRRRMILGGTLVGGALVVGYGVTHPMDVAGAILGGDPNPNDSAFGPFIRIDQDGWVTVVNRQQEMGQGIHAGLAAIVAEELDADWDLIRVVDSDSNFRAYGPQMTAGSGSIRDNWDGMRYAGAAARAMFVAAAAARWNAPPDTISVQDGVVSHMVSDRRATFGELLVDASRQRAPQQPTLKRIEDYRLIGTDRVRRKDCLPKTTGAQIYTQDIQLPNLLVAMVAHSPRFGGKVARFDASDALKIKGVVDVFAIESGIAVIAENTFAARRGREALRAEWDDSEAETRSSPALLAHFHEVGLEQTRTDPDILERRGDTEAAFGPNALEFALDFPYLAHAPMETMDCVAIVNGGRVKIISGAHLPTVDQVHAARVALAFPANVEIEVIQSGGSFGRRGLPSSDYVVECVRIAKRLDGRPVKLVWSREDDMAAGQYRPMAHHRAWVELDSEGYPAKWRHHVVSQALVPFGENFLAFEGIADSPYIAAASVVDGKVFSPRLPVPVAFFRSVGHSHTAMAMEHIIDQLARRADEDPAAYRRTLYTRADAVRHLVVLDEVTRRAGWGQPIDDRWARGLAIHEAFGTVVGQVAEVGLEEGRPVVRRVVAVVDCGIAISPDQIAAQMEGGIGFGLSAALYGAITLKDGYVQEINFDGYPVLRMNEMPVIETYIIPSTNRPSGMGEPGVPPIAPAVANALLALTGEPTRSLPFLNGGMLYNSSRSLRAQ